jgi:SRSO17 transposase
MSWPVSSAMPTARCHCTTTAPVPLPGERKSVEPIAALTAPSRTAQKNQSLLHIVANAPWSDEAV